jgi:predicted transcriptional regulator
MERKEPVRVRIESRNEISTLIVLLNRAVANSLELQEYHARLIKYGLEAVKTGRTMEIAEVRKRIAKVARGRRPK